MEERQDFREFEERSKLPAIADRETLEKLGARYFMGAGFQSKEGVKMNVHQMQYERQGDMYLWKRIGELEQIENQPFEIHVEFFKGGNGYGMNHYETRPSS